MRPETGPMKFGNDWRGVFIRGDDAFNYAMHLERLMRHQPPGDVIGMMVVRTLHELLRSSDERVPTEQTQHMRPYGEALVKDDAVDAMHALAAVAESASAGPSIEFELDDAGSKEP